MNPREFPFPAVPRVVYRRSSLVDVLCQVRFPVLLQIQTTPPVDFQARVASVLPIASEEMSSATVVSDPHVPKVIQQLLPAQPATNVWSFSSRDETVTIQLVRDNLTMVSRAYTRWEEFSAMFKRALNALTEIYQPPVFTRIGLRYLNGVRPSRIGLADASWRDLLNPLIAGELAEQHLAQAVQVTSRTAILSLQDDRAQMRLQHGLGRVGDDPEPAYIIDCDCHQLKSEITDVDSTLEDFHECARRAFRWCISDRLHDAMGPDVV